MGRRERLLRSIYERKALTRALNIFSTAASAVFVAAFAALLILIFARGGYLTLLKIAVSAGVPFIALGAVRDRIGAKRPYEVYEFYGECPKRGFFGLRRGGRSASFPSRHAYSAFVIATEIFFFSAPLGIAALALGAAICACRVLLGVHFVRDVACGAAVGALAGVLGELLIRI